MTNKNQNKTKATELNVDDYINSISDNQKRVDSKELLKLFTKITKHEPIMWGTSIIGFGQYHYKYDSGRVGDTLRSGFSARKNALTLYCTAGFSERTRLLEKLGKHKIGKSCLYIKKLSDVNIQILSEIIKKDWTYMVEKYPK